MRIVVGLGNPGDEYVGTRHNVGFAVVESLAQRWGASFARERRGSRLARAVFRGETVGLVEPRTYMNSSGEALAALDADCRPRAVDLVVVHDDLDLECGRVAVKCGGGTGGHRGLASIAAYLGPEFVRVRVGVGRPPRGGDVTGFVLGRFKREEKALMAGAIDRAGEAVESVLAHGLAPTMCEFNRRPATDAALATERRP